MAIRYDHLCSWIARAAMCLVVVLLLGCETAENRAAREAEKAARMALEEAESEARERAWREEEARAEQQVQSDIAACSTVADATRCEEAFWCRANPEQCVEEFGDPDYFIDQAIDSMGEDYGDDYGR